MAQLKVILTEDVESLGDAGDLVTVRAGFARNYLVPQGKAVLATAGKIQEIEHHRRIVAEKVERERKELERVRDRLQSLSLQVSMQAGEEGRLFGSVTALQIADLAAQQGVEIDRRRIQLDEPIKEVGEHAVPVRLHREVIAQLKVTVVAAE